MSTDEQPRGRRAATGPGQPAEATRPAVSRRMLLGVAGAGAAGLAAGTLGGITATPALAGTRQGPGQPAAGGQATGQSGENAGDPDGPVVAHLRDARTGELDIFAGTSQTRVHDPRLAAQLIRAIR